MMPFMTQPAVVPVRYVPKERIVQAQVFHGAQYLVRTPASAGNQQKWTLRLMLQRHGTTSDQRLFSVMNSDGNYNHFLLNGDRLGFQQANGNAMTYNGFGTALHRDYAGWLDVVLSVNTVSGLVALSVNGRPETLVTDANTLAGLSTWINSAQQHAIGVNELNLNTAFLDASVADVYFIDGAVLAASNWGEANIHGVWVPKPKDEIHAAIAAAGGFGANGFHLDFSDPLNPGKDVSGKGNDWTAVGFDATGKDTVSSTPTNVYPTLNPLAKGAQETLSDANLKSTGTDIHDGVKGTRIIPKGVPIYAECALDIPTSSPSSVGFGLVKASKPPSDDDYGAYAVGAYMLYSSSVYCFGKGDGTAQSVSEASAKGGDVFQVFVDLPNLWFGRNDVWYDAAGGITGNPEAGLHPSIVLPDDQFVFAVDTFANHCTVNFGQRPWAKTKPPRGRALCTDNLPEPDIKDPAEAFVQVATTGAQLNALLNSMTAHWGGEPYVEIVKNRNADEDWRVRFSDDPGMCWATNKTLAKAAAPALVSEGAYVGYRLRVGARYGVWTAEVEHVTGTATPVTHGLNTARNVVIATRVSAGGGNRYLRHPDMDAGKLMLMGIAYPGCVSDASLADFSANGFRIAATCPSGFYRVVVLAERAGLLSMGTYTGNPDGAFMPTDVLPDLFMTLQTTANGGVRIWDGARSPQNPVAVSSALTSSVIESSSDSLDFVVGGVKMRSTAATINGSGTKYLGIAWGRPVGGAWAAPATAR